MNMDMVMNNLPLLGGAGGGLLLLIIILIVVLRKRKKSGSSEEVVEETPDEVYNEEDTEAASAVEGLSVEYNQDNHNIISVKLSASFPFTVHSITPEESKYYTLFGAEGIIGRHMSMNKNFKVFLDKTDAAKSKGNYSFKLAIKFSKDNGTYTQMLYISKKNSKAEARITSPKAAA